MMDNRSPFRGLLMNDSECTVPQNACSRFCLYKYTATLTSQFYTLHFRLGWWTPCHQWEGYPLASGGYFFLRLFALYIKLKLFLFKNVILFHTVLWGSLFFILWYIYVIRLFSVTVNLYSKNITICCNIHSVYLSYTARYIIVNK